MRRHATSASAIDASAARMRAVPMPRVVRVCALPLCRDLRSADARSAEADGRSLCVIAALLRRTSLAHGRSARYRHAGEEDRDVVPSIIRRHKYGLDQSLRHALAECLGDRLPLRGRRLRCDNPGAAASRSACAGAASTRRRCSRRRSRVDSTVRSTLRTLIRSRRRLRRRPAQNRAERIATSATLSRCGARPRVASRRILLVDDVMTTGATADECARMLIAAGARARRCADPGARAYESTERRDQVGGASSRKRSPGDAGAVGRSRCCRCCRMAARRSMSRPDSGRNAIAMARAGMRVVAADFSRSRRCARSRKSRAQRSSPIWPVVADLEEAFPFRPDSFDAIINVSFLDRALLPRLRRRAATGGVLLFDTFLIDQADDAAIRATRASLLEHYELRAMLVRAWNWCAIARVWSLIPTANVPGARRAGSRGGAAIADGARLTYKAAGVDIDLKERLIPLFRRLARPTQGRARSRAESAASAR